MIDYQSLKPKRGQLVIEWWKNVIRWALSLPVIIGPNVLYTQTPMGMKVRVRTNAPVSTPFEVGLTGRRVRVSPGTVENESPWMQSEGRTPVRLDGRRLFLSEASQSEIYLDISDARPGPDRTSAIVVMLRLIEGEFVDPGFLPEILEIVHLSDYSASEQRRLQEDGAGFQVLAKLYWDAGGRAISRVGQVTHHNLSASIDDDGRILFSAV